MTLTWLKKFGAALTGLALAWGAPAAAEAPVLAKPALWKVSDADTTIYLFGTFHLLPKDLAWRTPAMDKALASSDALVMEVGDIDDQAKVVAALMKLAVSPGLPPIADRVPAAKKTELEAMIVESGLPRAALDGMETWAAGLLLTGVTFKRLGLDPNSGVERSLIAPWRASGKPLEGLETIEQQFGFFDTLSEEAQRKFLVALLDDPAKAKAEFAGMLKAWETGDVAGIARTFDDETQMSAELRAKLMATRNAHWAEWLKARMERPGTIFVAVGAGHLAGADSVLAMLGAKGLKAVRLQ
jgi:uncharacterized protein YbaP (TraB family)